LGATIICSPSAKFSWFGGILSKVYSELLQDFKTYHRAIEERYQIRLEQRMWWGLSDIEEVANNIASASAAW
jgi:hypothetical protein